jgi:hypothetical protein
MRRKPKKPREAHHEQAASPAPVRKTIIVKAGIEQAFAVFTLEMGRWWPKSHSINRGVLQKDVIMDPKPEGALV